MGWRVKALHGAVGVLADDPAGQLKHLKQIGVSEVIDELALEYDDIASAAEDMLDCGELDKKQYDAVKKLDGLLSRITGEASLQLWTAEALYSAPQWEEVRTAARDCLQLFQVNQ